MKYSAEVQTEPFRICDVIDTNERESRGHCCCKTQDIKNSKEEKKTCYCSDSSTSYMSIDSSSKSKHKLRKKKKRKTKKSKTKTDCECDEKTKSDKSVTTYADCACGSAVKDGTHTQTNKKNKSTRKDTKTDSWIPLDTCKCGSSLRICESDYSYYDKCSCDSTTDVDGK
ncbi:unnamed protein product [Danaus chrysippus]|uniref:(African queen) hypothetical protein n=1 Tax=Danaus chrysippus TaxID=151541 RepID=A0A8J2QN36_9NEOP|nr:unnamed protein product [Danaus chrysippus]